MGDLSNPEAFRALFDAHFADLHRYLAHRLGDAGAAEDLAAETFLRAYRARRRFRTGSARAWLFTIATNLLRDEARARTARDAALARFGGEAAVAAPDFELPDPELAVALATCGPKSARRSCSTRGPTCPTRRSRRRRTSPPEELWLAGWANLYALSSGTVARVGERP